MYHQQNSTRRLIRHGSGLDGSVEDGGGGGTTTDESNSVDDISLGSLGSADDPLVGRDLDLDNLARSENQAVSRLRGAVIYVLIGAAICCGYLCCRKVLLLLTVFIRACLATLGLVTHVC